MNEEVGKKRNIGIFGGDLGRRWAGPSAPGHVFELFDRLGVVEGAQLGQVAVVSASSAFTAKTNRHFKHRRFAMPGSGSQSMALMVRSFCSSS
jgi:hypothetical protein